MIPFLFFLALFLGFCMGAAPARACTTVLVGRDASETGEVLALVGGKDFKTSKFNRATQAYRQPGSSFKPIVYAAALEENEREDMTRIKLSSGREM